MQTAGAKKQPSAKSESDQELKQWKRFEQWFPAWPDFSEAVYWFGSSRTSCSSTPSRRLMLISAAVVSNLPFSGLSWVPDVRMDGRIVAGYGRDLVVNCRAVSQSYFWVMGIPLVSGRDFAPLDEDPARSGATVVNQTLARRLWPDSDPLGRRLSQKSGAVPHVYLFFALSMQVFQKDTPCFTGGSPLIPLMRPWIIPSRAQVPTLEKSAHRRKKAGLRGYAGLPQGHDS